MTEEPIFTEEDIEFGESTPILGPEYSAAAATELTRLRAKDYAADKLAEVYWRLRSYAVHDDDCTFNRHPHYRGCSCGLKDALDKGEATIRVFQPPPACLPRN